MRDEAGAAAAVYPFERWIAATRPPARIWRIAVGAVIGFACWFVVSIVVTWGYYFAWILLGDETSPIFQAEISGLATGSTHFATLVLLLAAGGFWPGAYLAARLMHGQKFWSLFGVDNRIRWRGFGIGILLTIGMIMSEWLWTPFIRLDEPYSNETDLVRWSKFAIPIIALVFIQAGGEELFFRGYLMRQLAARFRNPLVWAFLPSTVFGLLHFFNGISLEHSLYYVASTVLFGLTAAVTVWRTGNLSVAIGMHVSTNVLSFLYAGTDNFFTATPLFLWSVYDQLAAMPYAIASQVLLLAFVLSPWAPMPKRQLFAFRKETRAAP
jgi:uncharacterized protein